MPTIRSFWAILLDQVDEFYVQLLLILATVLLVLAIFGGSDGNDMKWVESVSVYFAVLFACLIQTLCDWGKER